MKSLRHPWIDRLMATNAWVVYAFFYLPILVLVVFSFNASARVGIWGGVSPRWYGEVLGNAEVLDALKNSLIVSGISTIVSTIIGTAAALAIDRYRFRGRRGLDGMLYLPIIIPDVTMAVMMLLFFARVFDIVELVGPRWQLGVTTIVISHVAFNIAFVAVVVRARLGQIDKSLEEAARDLYAGAWQTFRRVTLPLIMPGVLGGALLALTLSLDDVVVTSFVAGPGSTTLPIYVFGLIRRGVSPQINAISSLMLIASIALVGLSLLLQRNPQDAILPDERLKET
ncbi:MAG: ABC transporter permease [Acidimicrobiia bacterium]|nr:ABC transporter permease [Acidimicrobiia bacterium]MDH5420273.1 ABC transporter permease [Acidimicrobiia bacterium]MDH5502621.1 ABC transporter permease [Acidimicrobiia bacterium]